jgi:hypothetical protein
VACLELPPPTPDPSEAKRTAAHRRLEAEQAKTYYLRVGDSISYIPVQSVRPSHWLNGVSCRDESLSVHNSLPRLPGSLLLFTVWHPPCFWWQQSVTASLLSMGNTVDATISWFKLPSESTAFLAEDEDGDS